MTASSGRSSWSSRWCSSLPRSSSSCCSCGGGRFSAAGCARSGALQELLNKAAVALKVPQVRLPERLQERLFAVKYAVFLGLLVLTFFSYDLAIAGSNVEPFQDGHRLPLRRAARRGGVCGGAARRGPVRGALLLPLRLPAGGGPRDPRAGAHVRLAQAPDGMRQTPATAVNRSAPPARSARAGVST